MALALDPQQIAADPRTSVWVSANAGSGKTTVLARRVVRLLLEGNDPSRILCLTFTKAAAANMQNRVFSDELGRWVALSDEELSRAIAATTGALPMRAELARARRLFARAVETPGGLKIQTIHGFCERMLHLFPFEAGVPARFKVMEEREQQAACEAAIAATIAAALAEPEAPLGSALRTATDAAGEEGFRQALRAFMDRRRAIETPALERKYAVSPLRARLGVGAGDTLEAIRGRMLGEGLCAGDLDEVLDWLEGEKGGVKDKERAAALRRVWRSRRFEDWEDYAAIFLTQKGEPQKSLCAKALAKARADLENALLTEQQRVIALIDAMKAVEACERSEAIALIADEVNARYRAEKRRLGRLDFPDLIGKTVKLLRADAARWVLYKLDQGLDHVLVDEAQDTSPEQWRIVKALADDFFAGEGARPAVRRTVFAVGDEKQSIFGFQGARPEEFDRARQHFKARIDAYNDNAERPHAFASVPLRISYRTVDDILTCVDQVFSLESHYRGLASDNLPTVHESNRRGEPGLVELWPTIVGDTAPEPDGFEPVDSTPADAPPLLLARKVARRIRHWMENESRLEHGGARIGPGDVLILVRSRGALFDGVIKELRRAYVPVAGADRMKLAEQIAVMDLLALGRFCLLPEDDLTLAALMKSPLVGLDEDALMAVAHGRGAASLWDALRTRPEPAFAAAAAKLAGWRDKARQLDPHGFYADVLAADGGRRDLIARLGPDCEEAINVFLATLRQWQGANPPSLLAFCEAMAASEADVKRDMEDAHGRVRVMTVHAAKGLEARIVFLVDTFHNPRGGGSAGPRLLEIEEGVAETAVWVKGASSDPPVLAPARARTEQAALAESRRLLYVALTRAQDRLYICGAHGGGRRPPEGHWRGMIDAALKDHECCREADCEHGEGKVLQWRKSEPLTPEPRAEAERATQVPLPVWLKVAAQPDARRPPPLRPSRLADAADPPPLDDALSARAAARLRGELAHHLLQHLPEVAPARRQPAAERLAAARFPLLDRPLREETIARTLALMADPRFAALFSGEARAEVEIAGRLSLGGRIAEVAGRIDRLSIAPEEVTLMDFKTGRPPADPEAVPERHLRQLAVYEALLKDLYPERRIVAAVVWTALPAVVAVPPERLAAALAAIALP